MRIAYLTADYGIPVFGNKGASIHVREMSTALQSIGHEVHIFTPRLGGERPAGFDIPVTEVRFGKVQKGLVDTMKTDSAISDPAMKEIRSMLYGVTLVQELLPALEGWQPDAIYERYSLMSTAGVDLAKRLGIPHILEVNAPLADEAEAHRGLGFSRTVRETERMILQSADYVLAVSEELREWLIGTGVAPERITVTPNRVNIDRFARAAAMKPERPTVGFVGTLKAWHGTATLVEAIGEIARERGIDDTPQLLIVGDGPQRDMLETLARDQGITDLVRFTGMVDHDEMAGYIGRMSIAVAPYNPQPGFYFSPLKIFEYMAAGRAIIAANIGQIPQIVEQGRTGLLVEPGDTSALAAAITSLLDDRAQLDALGAKALREAVDEYSWEKNARVVEALVATPLEAALAGGDR